MHMRRSSSTCGNTHQRQHILQIPEVTEVPTSTSPALPELRCDKMEEGSNRSFGNTRGAGKGGGDLGDGTVGKTVRMDILHGVCLSFPTLVAAPSAALVQALQYDVARNLVSMLAPDDPLVHASGLPLKSALDRPTD